MSIFLAAALILIAAAAGFALAWVLRGTKVKIAEERRADAERIAEQRREDFERSLANLQATFRGLSAEVLKESREEFIKQAEPRLAEHLRPLSEALKRYDEALRVIEGKRDEAYGGLKRQTELLQGFAQQLRDETGNLKNALKSTTARGRWGEVTLKRVVELAGMSEHCDFEEQTTVTADASGEERRLRPDMIVHLPGGRSVVVDAKAPLDAYFRAIEATSDRDRTGHLGEHARAVRDHLRALSQKSYWEQFDSSTDLVVLFLPGESFAAAALEVDRTLLEDGMRSKVIIATPATLVALLRSFAMGWNQEKLAENAQRISEEGKELFDRFTTFSEHFEKVGGGLDRAIKSFNAAVRSMESRVMPSVRRLKELGATRSPDAPVPEISQIDAAPHQLAEPADDRGQA